jgi:hypothetical protein
MLGRMNMTPADIADVTSSTYSYLINGNPLKRTGPHYSSRASEFDFV